MKKINFVLLATAMCCVNPLVSKETSTIFQDVRNGDKEAIKKRLENYEDCSKKEDYSGNNALHIAAEQGNAEIVEMLTTEPDYSEWGNWFYYSLWQSPAKLPNKNEQNNDGNAPIHCAIQHDHINIAEHLINKNVNVELVNNENLSPASLIVKKDNPELIPFLIQYNLINQRKHNGDNLLHTAIKTNKQHMAAHLAEIGLLVNTKNNDGKTPTIVATELPDIVMLKILKRKHIDLNAPGSNGLRAIHNAAMLGNYNALNFLLEEGIFVDTTDAFGNTPLHYSCAHNKEKEMDLLLAYGADIKKRNLNGDDLFAIASNNEHYNLISRFKDSPAIDINARDNNGKTPFMRSVIGKNHTLMQTLIDAGVNIRITDKNNENALHKAAKNGDIIAAQMILTIDKKLLTDTNKNGENPLFTAVQHGQLPLAKLFTELGAPVITNEGNTPAHTAQTIDVLHNCIQYDPHMLLRRNKYNETPFLTATRTGNFDVVQFLLCDNDFCNRDIGVGINLARSNNHHKIVSFLQKAEKKRLDACIKTVNQRLEYENIEKTIDKLHRQLCQKDNWHILSYISHQPTPLKHYSADDLYYMTEAERTQISLAYTKCINAALQNKINLEQQLNVITLKEHTEQQNKKHELRATQEHAEHQRILAQQATDLKIFNDQQAELERIRKQKEAEEQVVKAQAMELKNLNDQHAELERIRKQKEAEEQVLKAQAIELKNLNEQHAELEHIRKQKEANERVPLNLKPSAPLLEEQIVTSQCAACNEKTSLKPLPCNTCKKKTSDICNKCLIKYKGQCPACWQEIGYFTQKENGECCIGAACCTEEQGVTAIPCNGCKVGTDRICKACLNICIEKNKKDNQPNRCPRCGTQHSLNEKIIKTILKQK